jgi:predicted alpha/beta-hydrolase family hydrolase
MLVLAHGAGAPMDSVFMSDIARMISGHGVHVVRFEFSYMAARRADGKKRPPSRVPVLIDEFRQILHHLWSAHDAGQLYIGGKSMGGRVASMLAAEREQIEGLAGLVCLGYPFHPPGKPDKLRTAHLPDLPCPSLIVQGERDPFGNADEVPGYTLPASMAVHWAPCGNHDLVPPKKSGFTAQQNWTQAAGVIAAFMLAGTK